MIHDAPAWYLVYKIFMIHDHKYISIFMINNIIYSWKTMVHSIRVWNPRYTEFMSGIPRYTILFFGIHDGQYIYLISMDSLPPQ